MALGKGRSIVLGAGALSLAALAVTCVGHRDALVDTWYLFHLRSEDLAVWEPAARKLIERGSARAIPELVRRVAVIPVPAIPGTIPADGDEALPALRKALVFGIQDILSREPQRAYAALAGLLETGASELTALVLQILSSLRGESQYQQLLAWLEGDSKGAFQLACYTFYAGGVAALPFLEQAAATGASPRVRRNAGDLLRALCEGEELVSSGGGLAAGSRDGERGGANASRGVLLFGQEYDGVFLCCDKSGSMRESGKFLRMREELLRIIEELEEEAQFGIAFFNASMSAFPWGSRRPARATPAWKAAAQGFILASSPGGASCSLPALRRCLEVAANSTARSKCVLYLSDGTYTCSGWDAAVYGREVLQKLGEENGGRVAIHTVFIAGPGGDESWMRDLASQNGGSCGSIGK